jgi:integrase/recombinase XerC
MSLIVSFENYLFLEKKYSVHTVKAYTQDLSFFLSFIIDSPYATDDLTEVNYPMIRQWIVKLIDSGLSNNAVNRKISSLKAFYKYLLKTGIIILNPLQQHKALKVPKNIQTPFSEKELDLLNDSNFFTDDYSGCRDKLIIDLFYTTGIRRSELINLKNENIDYANGQIKILGKRNKERIVPLLPKTLSYFKIYEKQKAALQQVIDKEYFFLTESGNKMYDMFVYRIINSYFSTVTEKKKKSPHMLRHTFATHMLNNGADMSSVKELLGHASLASTQVYTHSTLAELKNVHLKAHPRNKK